MYSFRKNPLKDTTFSALISIPGGEEAFFWLIYEKHLDRTEGTYKYKTNIRPNEPVDTLQVKVNIVESRAIITSKTAVTFGTTEKKFSETINNSKSVSYVYEAQNDSGEFQETLHLTYDVDRPLLNGGDILVRDGYFVHFISPETLPPIDKNIIFVIDKSGSMSSQERMHMLKRAFYYILNDLNQGDYFQIIVFNSEASTLYNEFQPVNSNSRAQAIARVREIQPGGLTNISEAMKLALQQESPNNAADIIIFLSDGFPTSGQTFWPAIRDTVRRENTENYAIFSVAIGSAAPYAELERMSIMNNGIARQVFDGIDVADQIQGFYDSVASPLIWNAKLSYENAHGEFLNSGNLFMGKEMVIVGKLVDPCVPPIPVCNDELLVSVDNLCSTTTVITVDCSTQLTIPPFDPPRDQMENPKIPLGSAIDLEKYYHYLVMQRWLSTYKVTDDDGERNKMKTEITEAAVDQKFVTPFTSMVVLSDNNARRIARTRVKHTKEWKEELDGLFANKAVQELVEKERHSLAKLEIEPARIRRATNMSFSHQSPFIGNLKWTIPLGALLIIIRYKRPLSLYLFRRFK